MADAADPLAPLENWLVQALAALDPSARRSLFRDLGRELRRRNQRRITRQVGPDGEPWPVRKCRSGGRIRDKAKMLLGFRDGRRMQLAVASDKMELGYAGRSGWLAAIHHYGEVGAVVRGGVKVKYPARPLLGLSQEDMDFVYDRITAALNASGD